MDQSRVDSLVDKVSKLGQHVLALLLSRTFMEDHFERTDVGIRKTVRTVRCSLLDDWAFELPGEFVAPGLSTSGALT